MRRLRPAAHPLAALAALITLAALAPPVLAAPDPTPFDRALRKHVRDGHVDYAAWKKDRADLDRYLAAVRATDPATMHFADERKAFWINVYNACTIALVLDRHPLKSLRQLDGEAPVDRRTGKKGNVFDLPVCHVGGQKLSLNDVEHRRLRRDKPVDPRIHFVLNCASRGCPKLESRAFFVRGLDARLEAAARAFFAEPRNLRVDLRRREIRLSHLLHPEWLGGDFTASGKPLLEAISRWVPEPLRESLRRKDLRVVFVDWDWALNGR